MAESFPQIILLAEKSGIPYKVGSTFRAGSRTANGTLDYHSKGQAVDFMGYNQDQLAEYFMGLDTLEVIHQSQATEKIYGSSNNTVYKAGSNVQLLKEHENHLHVAMSPEQANKALASGGFARPIAGIPNPIDALKNVGILTGTVISPNFWKRVGMGVLGSTLILLGVWQFAKRPILDKVHGVTGAVKSVAGVAVQGAAFGAGAGKFGGSAATVTGGPPRGKPKAPPAVAPVTAVLPPSQGGLAHAKQPISPAPAPRSPVQATATVMERARTRPLGGVLSKPTSGLSNEEVIARLTNPKLKTSEGKHAVKRGGKSYGER